MHFLLFFWRKVASAVVSIPGGRRSLRAVSGVRTLRAVSGVRTLRAASGVRTLRAL